MARESRADARIRITGEIMDAARRQLGEVGAAGLSLREIAREMGMVSSAVYRYVASRDELLTRLIIDAYDALGEVAEEVAAAPADTDLDRWVATARAIRSWAHDHRHEYELLYGSPVPGYAAPDDTVGPGIRVVMALAGIVGDAARHERLAAPAEPVAGLTPQLDADLRALADAVPASFPADAAMVLAFVVAWSQLFGLLSFELTNQTRGFVGDDAELFEVAAHRVGHQIGLR